MELPRSNYFDGSFELMRTFSEDITLGEASTCTRILASFLIIVISKSAIFLCNISECILQVYHVEDCDGWQYWQVAD